MPELPDVEAFKTMIDDNCLGKQLVAFAVVDTGRKLRTLQMTGRDFAAATEGRSWTSTERLGKFLVVSQDDGNTVIFHFMLSGGLAYLKPREAGQPVANARLRFTFDDGSELVFTDRRNLGKVFWTEGRDFSVAGVLARLGVEPLSPDFSREAWRRLVAEHGATAVKDLLCDQRVIAGIGNVYSDAILWEARVRPTREAGSLSGAEADRLYEAIPRVLRRATDALRSGDASPDGLLSQRRRGGVCPRDESRVEAIKRGQTHSYYCPACQK